MIVFSAFPLLLRALYRSQGHNTFAGHTFSGYSAGQGLIQAGKDSPREHINIVGNVPYQNTCIRPEPIPRFSLEIRNLRK
jgi:hypothetical protein